jgi:predicted CoA-substrate-specific enzyme activase
MTVAALCVAGVDVGSTLTKVVVLDGEVRTALTGPTEADHVRGAAHLLAQALQRAGCSPGHLGYLVATGYGRRRLPFADREVTEITCHARGVRALFPGARTVIDIGGQDVKGIKLSPGGQVANFVMNDKCAAGTGRFLEAMAGTLGLTLEELATRGLRAAASQAISSVCTVFAQQEVVRRLAEGASLSDVLAGLHEALASRICRLVRRLGLEPDVVVTGGGAKNPTLVQALGRQLGVPVRIPPDPLVTGALGAAVLAREACDRAGGPRGAARGWVSPPPAPAATASGAGAPAPTRFPHRRQAVRLLGQFPLPGLEGHRPSPLAAGVDLGSLYTKAVVLAGERAWFAVVPSRGDFRAATEEALAEALSAAGLPRAPLEAFLATGLGATGLREAPRVSDVTCAARGAWRMCPDAELVMDIGGQGTRAIRVGPRGVVRDFTTSGQCAAGSARLLELVAGLLHMGLDELGQSSLRSRDPATFTVGCAVFAETEAISLLAAGTRVEDLVAGLHRSLAAKIVALARAAGPARRVVLAGGGARDVGLVAQMRRELPGLVVPAEPMVLTALGAALLAAEPREATAGADAGTEQVGSPGSDRPVGREPGATGRGGGPPA